MNTKPIDLLHVDVRRDPFPVYRELRRRGPAVQVEPGGMWALSRYADVVAALHDPATYSSQGFRAALAPDWLGDDRLTAFLIAMDPPEHTKLRKLVHRMFGQELISSIEQPLRSFIARYAGAIDETREVEVVSELATPIAAGVIATILGVDPEHHARFKHWVDMIGMMTPAPPDAATAAAIRRAIDEEDQYFREVIERRRRAPGKDVVSLLIESEVDGQRLRTRELVAFLALILGAGIDTTIHLISKSLLFLSERADLLAQLRGDFRLLPPFVEEMLRFDPPTHALPRLTTTDVQLESAVIPAQSLVLLLLASANRDPAQYVNPDEFILQRNARGTLAFGHGPHLCIGAALARFETRVTLELLLPQFGSFERDAAQPIAWDTTIHTRGPLSLPMRFVRARA